jgi:hypothetical protein
VVALLLVAWTVSTVGAAEARRGRRDRQERSSEVHLFRRILFYVPNRIIDFADVWKLNVGVGLGLGANIRPTKGLQFGIAAYDSVRAGLRGRRLPVWHEWSLEGGFDGMYHEFGETERGFYEFGGTIHLAIIGFEAAVDIEEVLDFGYGLFILDPADDDLR